jgi:hypothetical protein
VTLTVTFDRYLHQLTGGGSSNHDALEPLTAATVAVAVAATVVAKTANSKSRHRQSRLLLLLHLLHPNPSRGIAF